MCTQYADYIIIFDLLGRISSICPEVQCKFSILQRDFLKLKTFDNQSHPNACSNGPYKQYEAMQWAEPL